MYQNFYIRKYFIILFSFISLFIIIFVYDIPASAMSLSHYSYKQIYNKLPKKYQSQNYLYANGNIPYISFAKYADGRNYRTSVKKSNNTNQLLYCMDTSKVVKFDEELVPYNTMFDNQLRTRIAIAFHYGPKKWGELADKAFTTGNCIQDYYMTQAVIHGLIYQYGGNQSKCGLNIDQIIFKDKCEKLKNKTMSLYHLCCDAKIELKNGHFQRHEFLFNKPNTDELYLDEDFIISPIITSKINNNNAKVENFDRKIYSDIIEGDAIIKEESSNEYNSDFSFKVKLSSFPNLDAGNYQFFVKENVTFHPELAGIWSCKNISLSKTTQNVGGTIYVENKESDDLIFHLQVGEIVLYKTDALTKENISDAKFKVYQYNENLKKYEYYKDLSYNSDFHRYECKQLIKNQSNPNGLFKIIEYKSGQNYMNDWDGEIFQLTKNNCMFEYHVENMPYLGKLLIKKDGENFHFNNNKFEVKNHLPMKEVTFSLFSKNDIYLRNKLIYKKDTKIMDLITNDEGICKVENLLPGKYYVKEVNTNRMFHLDEHCYEFNISKNNNQFSETSYQMTNYLKRLRLDLFKYHIKNHKEIPINHVKFGLYAAQDIKNIEGQIIIKKDDLIESSYTNMEGKLSFVDIPYANYYIKEIEAPSQIMKEERPIYIQKDEFVYDGSTYYKSIKVKNELKNCNIHLFKYTENNHKKTPLKNAKFALYAAENIIDNDNLFLFKKDEIVMEKYSDDNGVILFENIPYANYYIKELESPKGYQLNQEIIEIEKSDFIYNNNSHIMEYNFESSNSKLYRTIKLTKMGEYIKSKHKEESEFGEYYVYDYDYKPIKNIKFNLFNNKKEMISSKVTDEHGIIYFDHLIPGTYYYKEENAPKSYKIDSDLKKIVVPEFPSNHQIVNHYKPEVLQFEVKNTLITSKLNINKYGETVSFTKKGIHSGIIPLSNVTFGVYQYMDEENQNLSNELDDLCIANLTTDLNGEIHFESKLPEGRYFIKEVSTLAGYQLDEKKYEFQINPNHKDIIIHLNDHNKFINQLLKGSVEITKKDSNTNKPLKNVEFTLYDEDGNKIDIYKTNRKGKINIKELPYGKYYFIETKCKKGYYSSNNKYKFTIDSDKKVHLNINNFPILKLGFSEHYKTCIIIALISLMIFTYIQMKSFLVLKKASNKSREKSNPKRIK